MIPCLCPWAGLCVSFIYLESAIQTLKIVTFWLQSNKLSSVLNRIFFFQHLRDNFLRFCSLKMPLVRMFKATASAAALFQWQDRLGSSMKTIKKENNASVLCRDNKKWLFVSCEFVGAEWLRASHRWVSIKFRHHKGIPSPTWLCLKVEFLSISNIGLKCNVI